ncbi:MAG: DUF1127 domain-containing protein [Acidiferrobacterales bacterium]
MEFSTWLSFTSRATGPAVRSFWNAPRLALSRTAKTFFCWQERARQRHALSELDDRLLKDVGISRAEAEREGRKPFWRQ